MARSFTASTHNLRNTSATSIIPGATGTIALWCKPNWNHNDSASHVLFRYGQNAGSAPLRLVDFTKFSDNNVYVGWFLNSDDDRLSTAATATMFTNGTWQHLALTWSDSANTEELFAGGSSVGTRTAALITGSLGTESLTIGNTGASETQLNCNATLAEFAQWSVILDADELAALAKGYSPWLIRTGSLVHYHPLIGRYSPEIGPKSGIDLTVTNTANADHPRIIYARNRQIFTGTTAITAVTGTGADTLQKLTQSATGTAGNAITGTAADTLRALTESGTGIAGTLGQQSASLRKLTESATGRAGALGQGTGTFAFLNTAATGISAAPAISPTEIRFGGGPFWHKTDWPKEREDELQQALAEQRKVQKQVDSWKSKESPWSATGRRQEERLRRMLEKLRLLEETILDLEAEKDDEEVIMELAPQLFRISEERQWMS